VFQHKDHLGNVRLRYAENTASAEETVFSDGFESMTNWDKSANSFGWAVSAIDTNKKHSGTSSGRIDPEYPSVWSKYVYSNTWTPIDNTEASYYTISAWVFLEDVFENRVRFALSTRKAGELGYPVGFYPIRSSEKGVWTYITTTVLVPAEVRELNLRIENEKGGIVWFDEVKIVKGNASKTVIIEESNYYPFGLKHKGYNNLTSSNGNSVAQKYKYNGKEYEEIWGYNMYEMDMRSYDPATARWVAQDPVIYFEYSPYSAFDNNPVYFADPSGADSGVNSYLGRGRRADNLQIYNFAMSAADVAGAEGRSVKTTNSFTAALAFQEAMVPIGYSSNTTDCCGNKKWKDMTPF
jgi:RHS repeat-associated protein